MVRAARPLPTRTASMVPEEANGVAGPAGTPHTVGPGTVGVGVFELVWVGVGKTVAAGVVAVRGYD